MSTPKAERHASMLVGADVPGHASREENMEDFSAEWCQKLLNDPAYSQSDFYTRRTGGIAGSSYNILMGKTLFTDETFRAVRVLYKPPEATTSSSPAKDGAARIGGEVVTLISLGGEMCSHTDVLHGGINTVLVDEVGGDMASRVFPEPMMAVRFEVNLRKSVRTPGIILGRAWIERKPEGRKVWVKVRLEQDGQTCIEAENLYVKMKKPVEEKL